jgi:Cof subfamily protein (haloacid dehalogenase superfamily)
LSAFILYFCIMIKEVRGIVATDLDGTLMDSNANISEKDLLTLEEIGANAYLRVIATGRSLFSFVKAVPEDLSIDYVVFSSGAGIYDWKNKRMIYTRQLSKEDTEKAFRQLLKHDVCFSIQEPIPNNHRFVFYTAQSIHPDFQRRNELYEAYCRQISDQYNEISESCQLLAITDETKGLAIINELERKLEDVKIIRSTSPIDHQSVWIEVFAKDVSKAIGVAQLAEEYKLSNEHVMAVGNDFNDLELLQWAGSAYVVSNAPDELKGNFQEVSSNNDSGFTMAVNNWLKKKREF